MLSCLSSGHTFSNCAYKGLASQLHSGMGISNIPHHTTPQRMARALCAAPGERGHPGDWRGQKDAWGNEKILGINQDFLVNFVREPKESLIWLLMCDRVWSPIHRGLSNWVRVPWSIPQLYPRWDRKSSSKHTFTWTSGSADWAVPLWGKPDSGNRPWDGGLAVALRKYLPWKHIPNVGDAFAFALFTHYKVDSRAASTVSSCGWGPSASQPCVPE